MYIHEYTYIYIYMYARIYKQIVCKQLKAAVTDQSVSVYLDYVFLLSMSDAQVFVCVMCSF